MAYIFRYEICIMSHYVFHKPHNVVATINIIRLKWTLQRPYHKLLNQPINLNCRLSISGSKFVQDLYLHPIICSGLVKSF